jgi:hypothetical protein
VTHGGVGLVANGARSGGCCSRPAAASAGRVAQRVGGEEGRPAAWVTIGERGPA